MRRLWEIPNQFTLQYTSFDQHKEIIIEEIHVAGTAMGVTGKGSRNQPFFLDLWFFCEGETLLHGFITWSAGMCEVREQDFWVEAAVLLQFTLKGAHLSCFNHHAKTRN